MYMQSLTDYLVNICAVIGGVYAVSSVMDSVIRNSVGILGFGSVEDLPGHGTTQGGVKRQAMKRVKRTPDQVVPDNQEGGDSLVSEGVEMST